MRRRPRRRSISARDPDPLDIEATVVDRESAPSAWAPIDRLSGDRRRA
jgi:hypothetical protein